MRYDEHGYYDEKGRLLGWAKDVYDDDDPNYKWLIFWPPHSGLSVHVKVKKSEREFKT
jgi:hypothetical protein